MSPVFRACYGSRGCRCPRSVPAAAPGVDAANVVGMADNGAVSDMEFRYRGNRLGMSESGSGSIPGFGRRFVAVTLDWLLSLAITQLVTGGLTGPDLSAGSGLTLLVFAAMTIALLILFGTTVGKRIVGVGVAMTGERPLPWPIAMVVRTVLLCLVIPAVIHDRDQRGLHDRAAGTVTRRY